MSTRARTDGNRPVTSRIDKRHTASSRLRAADRDYLSLISEAAFANPFSAERGRIDAGLIEPSPVADIGDDAQWTPRMLAKLDGRMRAMFGARAPALGSMSNHDRVLVENAIFFQTFHRFVGPLNAYIEAQAEAGDTPLRVPFADALLRHLVAHGIADERAHRIFELFYQMGRAHHFIVQGLAGASASMAKLRETLWEAIFTRDILRYEQYLWNRMEDFSTILVGETGTGKGSAAAAIGRSGFIAYEPRKQAFSHGFSRSFVPINLNEYAENLFESEIFGHRKGAFTGATFDHQGVLSRCAEFGSVFFDEIGDATLPIQVKLLRVLQDRTFTPVGSRTSERFAGRILAATHRSLHELRERGQLRDDFYYRLCANVIELPPLRVRIAENKQELATLIEHLCVRIVGTDTAALAAEITDIIQRDLGRHYTFPGNVRELEQCVRRVLLTGGCSADAAVQRAPESALLAQIDAGNLRADTLVARYCGLLYQRHRNFVEVARITGLDRRTVKKHVESLETG